MRYNTTMNVSLTTFLKRFIAGIIVFLIFLAVVFAVINLAFGSETGKYCTVATAAIVSAVVAALSVFVTSYDIRTRVRPYVTVAEVSGMNSTGPSGEQTSIPYILDVISLVVQNTGAVPADACVRVGLKNAETQETFEPFPAQRLFLPPGGRETILLRLTDDCKALQVPLNTNSMKLLVVTEYRALERQHRTKQWYLIRSEKGGMPAYALGHNHRVFRFVQDRGYRVEWT